MDNASALAARLADAARRTALQRTVTSHRQDAGATTATARATGAAVPLEDMAALWTVYGRRVWPLGDDITDDRILVEGRDRRSSAALNHYLREGTRPQEHRRPCDRPRMSTARVSFHLTDDEDTLHITYHPASLPTPATTPARSPASGPAPIPGATSTGDPSPVPPARILDVLVADR